MQRELGQFDKAVASFRKASSLQPDLENAMFNEGVVLYYDLKRKDEAEIAWKRLLKANPGARAPDGKPVSLLFVLLVPEHANEQHLQILSELAERFSDRNCREALAKAESAEAVLEILSH